MMTKTFSEIAGPFVLLLIFLFLSNHNLSPSFAWELSKHDSPDSSSYSSTQCSNQLSSPGGCLNQHLAKDNATLPNVLLIGVQKAGTSALSNWLKEVGGVCMSKVQPGEPSYYEKEAHYFDYFNTTGKKRKYDFDHSKIYARRFAHCCTEQNTALSNVLALDATPYTVLFPKRVRSTFDSVDLTGELAKRVKLIIILREPISRELSAYNHYAFNCREYLQYGRKYVDEHNYTHFRSCSAKVWNSEMKRMKNFSEFIDDITLKNARFIPEPDPLVGSSRNMNSCLYADFLREWFSIFDREQILVLSQEELVRDEGSFLNRVHSFLGLSSSIDNFSLRHTNSKDDGHKVEAILCSDEEKLDQVFDPLNEDLYRLLEAYPGPPMEQRPFQKFVKPNCTVEND
mmetsp:Transcript_24288/g.36007  ORF Transcript_24288/g.36007 Transcript_24288/m.36007 type:complete len:399 (-) Transcript_24288:132-1328(-)